MFPTRGAFRFFNVPAVLHAACSNRPSRSLSRGSPARRFSMGSRRPFAFLFPAVHASALAALFPRQPAPAFLSSLSYCLGCNRSLLAPAAHPRPHAPACSHPPVARPLLPLPFPAGQKKRAVLYEPLPELFLCAPRPPGRPPRLNRRATPPRAPSCCGKRSSRRRPPRGAPPASRPTRGPRRRAPWYP